MDRRTLLAIVLATLVVIIFQFFFLRPARRAGAPAAPPDSAQVQAPADAAPESVRAAAPPAASAPAKPMVNALAAEEREVVVETGDYRAVLSTRGAALRALTLLRYPARDHAPVEMVQDGEGEFGVTFMARGARTDLSGALFALEEAESEAGRVFTFTAADSTGLTVVRRYIFPLSGHAIRHEIEVSGSGSLGEDVDYAIEWSGGLPVTERSARTDMGAFAAITAVGKNIKKDRPKAGDLREHTEAIHWTGVRSKYFLAAIVPTRGNPIRVETFGDRDTGRLGTRMVLPVLAGETTRHEFLLYAGPVKYHDLKALGVGLERAVDLGWNAFRWLSVGVLEFLVWAHRFLPNYAIVIIVLSALTKLVFHPLTASSLRSMAAMQRLKPEMDALKAKFKDNPQRMNQATMELYRKHKVNPLGGCLPIVVQMPVFIALYNVLSNAIELRRAPCGLWVRDLSAPDTVGHVMGLPINILPLVMTGTTILQQKMTPTDPRQAAMAYMMPIIMLVFFYSFPSGLVIYWTVNNVLQIAQQWWIRRGDPAPVVVAEPERGGSRRPR
jgi:YidC/Oxa1 family membrane protein insertase